MEEDCESRDARERAEDYHGEKMAELRAFIVDWRARQEQSYRGAGYAVAYDAIGDMLNELESIVND